jgi:glycosyltransferase involved in cell wall biosynthesis
MPLFSVIINNYNYGRFLGKAIDSVLLQTFRDFELIVVDDGSSDNSVARIREYGDQLKLVQTNRVGQARACQRALWETTGAYVYFLDADDESCPELLHQVFRHIGQQPSKLQFQLEPIDVSSAVIGRPFPHYPHNYGRNEQINAILATGRSIAPPTSGNVFKSDLFRYFQDINYETAIDGIPLLLAPLLGEVVSIRQVLARYRVHGLGDSGILTPTPQRFQRERDRFIARYRHLKQLNDQHGFGRYQFRDPTKMSYYLDRNIMMKLCASDRVAGRDVMHCISALVRESGFSVRTIRLALWYCVCKFGPARMRRNVFAMRAKRWAELSIAQGLLYKVHQILFRARALSGGHSKLPSGGA